MDSLKSIYLNIFEIPVDENLIEESQSLDAFLYECQCALFLIDITSKKSFELIKKLINLIEFQKFPYMKSIILQNKSDKEESSQINDVEIKDLLNIAKNSETLKISTKDKSGINELIIQINKSVNESKNELFRIFINNRNRKRK